MGTNPTFMPAAGIGLIVPACRAVQDVILGACFVLFDLCWSAMTLTLCVLLWARPGAADALAAYEDQVLALVPEHGGQVLQRARGSGEGGQPLEIQFLEFPSAAALDEYMADDRRTALAHVRDHAIARTQVINVELVPPVPGPATS
jgi:uncharacterized protein (DUF1330 family)